MSSAIHRTTKRFIGRGCSAAKNPPKDWILNPEKTNPDLNSQPIRYWKIAGDVVSVMSTVEMDTEDQRISDEQATSVSEQGKAFLDGNSIERAIVITFHKSLNAIRNHVGMPLMSKDDTINAIKAELD